MAQGVASVVHTVQRVARQVKVLLWSNNVDFFAVLNDFADEGHILQTKQRQLALGKCFRATKSELCLPIESTLTEDRADKSAIVDVVLDVGENLILSVSRTANDNDMRARNHIFGVFAHFVQFADEITLMFPS